MLQLQFEPSFDRGLPVLLCKSCFLMLIRSFKAKFTLEKGGSFYQNNVNLSLTFPQKQGYQVHNCKMAYCTALSV